MVKRKQFTRVYHRSRPDIDDQQPTAHAKPLGAIRLATLHVRFPASGEMFAVMQRRGRRNASSRAVCAPGQVAAPGSFVAAVCDGIGIRQCERGLFDRLMAAGFQLTVEVRQRQGTSDCGLASDSS